MKENIKTILLTLLVAVSLMQSYLLAFSSPKFEAAPQSAYVEAPLTGPQAELGEMVFPDPLIVHLGKKQHTILPINHQFYQMIYTDFLRKRLFDGFRKTTLSGLNYSMDTLRNDQIGIEVRFHEALSLPLLQTVMQVHDDGLLENELITRIWIVAKNAPEEVHVFFFTDSGAIYEAVKADVTAKDVENKVALCQYLTPYHQETGDYYLPDKPIDTVQLKVPVTSFSPDQLKRGLFVDPALTRFLLERDGSQIFTDGNRVLQIKNEQHWFSFTDPVSAVVDTRSDLKETLAAAVQFTNQHGGWGSTYLFSRINRKAASASAQPQTVEFREYAEGLPIVSGGKDDMGTIRLTLQKGIVAGYARPLQIMGGRGITRTPAVLPGGKELQDKLAAYPHKELVMNVFAAYSAAVQEQSMVLTPRWAVELMDGTVELLG